MIVVGSTSIDHTLAVGQFPQPGETVLGGRYVCSVGGKGANQAVSSALSGAKTLFITRVGEDEGGDKARQILLQKGLYPQGIQSDPKAPTGTALIFVNQAAENSIGVAAGANQNLSPQDIDAFVGWMQPSAIMLLQLEIPLATAVYAIEQAKVHKMKVVLNTAPACPLPDSLCEQVDYLLINQSEAQFLCQQTTDSFDCDSSLRFLHQRGFACIILTLGEAGCVVSHSAQDRHIVPSFKVKAVDTTAAGDAFAGAFCAALDAGHDVFKAAEFATAAGALAVTKKGAVKALPCRQEIERLLLQAHPAMHQQKVESGK